MRKMALSLIFSLLLSWAAWAEEVRLFLVHTNDIHGHLEAVSGQVESGGFVRAATVIRTLQATFPGRVVLLDAGDMAVGTPTSGLFFGIPVAESMKSLGYDAVAIGNHEFDWGQEAMAKMLTATGAPALCANLVDSETGSHPYPPFVVLERAGVKLGIIGLVAPDTPTRTPEAYTRGWSFLPAEPAARQTLEKLPEVDAVIALTHLGEPADRELARQVPELDLIIGGHSHTALHEVVTENGVPIVQSGCYSRFVGVLEVMIDTEDDSLDVLSYRLVPINSSIAPDPQVSSIVEGYASQVRPLLDRVIGEVREEVLNQLSGESLDRPLGNLTADMLRAESGADVAFYNRGGVRGHLKSGPLDVRTLHEMFPFNDPIVILEATGEQLHDVVIQGTNSQAQLSPSGLSATFDGDTLSTLLINGQPLQPHQRYTIATTNFLATGGDNMSLFTGLIRTKHLRFTRDVLQSYIEKHPLIASPGTGRLQRVRMPQLR